MADSGSRAQRAAALEEKRRKLEDLKKKRALRKEDTTNVRTRASANANLDEYIDGLLSQPSVAATAAEARSELAAEKEARAAGNSVAGTDGNQTEGETNDGGSQKTEEASTEMMMNNAITQPAPAPPLRQVETFGVGTQTEEEDFPEQKTDDDEPELEEEAEETEKDPETTGAELQEEQKIPKILTGEEVEKEVIEGPFTSFIATASKKVERVMGTPLLADLLSDYIGEADSELDRTSEAKDSDVSRFVSSRQVYECKKWTATRDITDIDWSPLHRELFLSTHHVPNSTGSASPLAKGSAAVSAVAPNGTLSSSLTPRSGEVQSDGLAVVWSLSMPERPEHVFTCGSPATTGRFHPSESTLVLGGCESGQLVVWDVRGGRLPVQKSALTTVLGASAKAHTHPICAMEVIEGGVSSTLLEQCVLGLPF